MSRYIEAEWLKSRVRYVLLANGAIHGCVDELDLIEAPSIDIVRCRECKHREEYPCKVYHDDDWYCADGEREGE